MLRAAASLAPALFAVVACNGTTGDQLITFSAYASGASGAAGPFTTYDASGRAAYTVQLTRAKMHLGALYFDQSPPSSGFDSPTCITPDLYAAQVPGGIDVDLLSTAPQPFATAGNGSADVAQSWDLWLTNGDINATANLGVHIVDLQGVATRVSDNKPFAFGAIVTINGVLEGAGARLTPATTPGLPGQYPICKERILALDLPQGLPFFQGGALQVTVDPRVWLATSNIDFAGGLESWDSEDCQADPGANATYESGEACAADGSCADGFVCNTGDGQCIAQFCIPDTNYPTDTTVSAALDFFTAIQGGGAAAYSVTYAK
jgi:hypothetical protein